MGLEPTTSTLARLRSTTELRPRIFHPINVIAARDRFQERTEQFLPSDCPKVARDSAARKDCLLGKRMNSSP